MVIEERLAEGWIWAGKIIKHTPEQKSHLSPRIHTVTKGVKPFVRFPDSPEMSVWEGHQLCLRAFNTSVDLFGNIVL